VELAFERVCNQLGSIGGLKEAGQWVRSWTFMKEAFVEFVLEPFC
jgi:hypothetical protein